MVASQPCSQVQLNSPESLHLEIGLNNEMEAINKKLATIFIKLTTLCAGPTELTGEPPYRDGAQSWNGLD